MSDIAVLLIVLGVIICVVILSACSPIGKNPNHKKPIFGRLIINLEDPEADMFKLEIDIDDPNALLKAKMVVLEVVEVTTLPAPQNSQKKHSL